MNRIRNTHTCNTFIPPNVTDSRSPCPALNALANHGYIPHNGAKISLPTLMHAIRNVYHLSFPLALFLTFIGFLTAGEVSKPPYSQPTGRRSLAHEVVQLFTFRCPRWTLDLASLSTRGPAKISHDASLVHPDNIPSTSPDANLLTKLLRYATYIHNPYIKGVKGLALVDLAQIHAAREASLVHSLNWLHEQVALGECALAWAVMRDHKPLHREVEDPESEDIIPISRLEQWFGEERLPDGWWDGGARPADEIGLIETRRWAKEVGRDMQQCGRRINGIPGDTLAKKEVN